MAVRNSHARMSSLYKSVTVGSNTYHIYSADWTVDNNKRNYVANKLKQGKLQIPANAQVYYGQTILYATADNKLSSEESK